MRGSEILQEETFYSLVQYDKEVPITIAQLTNITTEEVKEAPPFSDVYVDFLKFKSESTLVAHHSKHERAFMEYSSSKLLRMPFKHRIIDTSFLFKIVNPTLNLVALEELCEHHQIPIEDRHHALGDAILTAKLWGMYINHAIELGCETLSDVYEKFSQMR